MYKEEWEGYPLAHTRLGKVRYQVNASRGVLDLIACEEDGGLTLKSGRTYFAVASSYKISEWYYNGTGFPLKREGIYAYYMKTPRTKSRYLRLEDDDAAEIEECLREAYDSGAFDHAPQLDPVRVAERRKQADEYRSRYITLLQGIQEFNSFVGDINTNKEYDEYRMAIQTMKLKYQY